MPNDCTILTVLIVEDEPLVRMYGVDVLEDAGYQVLEAGNADEALVILDGDDVIDLLFSDVDMPGTIDGMQLARIVHERWPRVRLLMTSGHHRLQDMQVPGNGKFVRKPWSAGLLAENIDELGRA